MYFKNVDFFKSSTISINVAINVYLKFYNTLIFSILKVLPLGGGFGKGYLRHEFSVFRVSTRQILLGIMLIQKFKQNLRNTKNDKRKLANYR